MSKTKINISSHGSPKDPHGDRYEPEPPNRWVEHPCSQCGGDGWVEVPSHFRQGRSDGEIVYHREECDECEGSGEAPQPDGPLHCEIFDFEGEPLEHESCDYCHCCLVCWACECQDRTRELAIESRITEELNGRQQPIKLPRSTD